MTENMTVKSECKPRDPFDAPSYSLRSVMEWLIGHGACGIINTRGVAYIVGCSMRVVKDAERRGEIKAIDKCTYKLESVAQWLMKHPRFISQSEPGWEIDEARLSDIRNLLVSKHQALIAMFHDDAEELVQEVAYRLMNYKKTRCSFSTAVYSVVAKIARDEKRRIQTVSLTTVK